MLISLSAFVTGFAALLHPSIKRVFLYPHVYVVLFFHVFFLPQMVALGTEDGKLQVYLYIAVCFCACLLGLYIGSRAPDLVFPSHAEQPKNEASTGLLTLCAFTAICGVGALMLKGLPVERQPTGIYAIATTLRGFLVVPLAFSAISLLTVTPRKWARRLHYVIILACIFFLSDALVQRGKRTYIFLASLLLLLYAQRKRQKVVQFLILVVSPVAAFFLLVGIGEYRHRVAAGVEPIAALDYIFNNFGSIIAQDVVPYELRNALEFIHSTRLFGSYDFGLIHWDETVHSFLPSNPIIDKHALKFGLGFTTGERLPTGFTPKSGTPWTGPADAFGSFGWLGGVKFLVLGYFLARFSSRLRSPSIQKLHIYMLLLWSLGASFTHHTQYFINTAILLSVFHTGRRIEGRFLRALVARYSHSRAYNTGLAPRTRGRL